MNFYDDFIAPLSLQIDHNVIDKNHMTAVHGFGGSPTFRNNHVTRNAGGFWILYCLATFEHNTIAGNHGISIAGGIEAWDGFATVRHCVVTGNAPDSLQAYYNGAHDMRFDSCNIPGNWPLGTGNIDIDPLFRDTARGDFYATSDAITTLPLPSCGNEIPDSMEIWINPHATAVEDKQRTSLPTDFVLAQNYPNPFNPSTTIALSLPYRAHVRLEIFNTLGQIVRTLCDDVLPAGETLLVWDGKDSRGEAVSSGLYFYRLTADERT